MIKFTNWDVVFQEVPDEVSLAFNISNCPIHCPGCHSKWLWDDVGNELTFEVLDEVISSQLEGITCVAFMGGDADVDTIVKLAQYVRDKYNLKIAWYSGRVELPIENYQLVSDIISNCDYIKLGPYIETKGGLSSPTTNQVLYKVVREDSYYRLDNITFKFRDHE